MSKKPPLTIEQFSGEEEKNKYRINSQKEIQLTLHAIAQKKTVTFLYYDQDQRFLKTILLAANEQGVWLDVGPDNDDNTLILNSDTLTFVTLHNGAKVQFTSQHIQVAIYATHPAFFCPLPDHIFRLQRRDYFRLPIPPDSPLSCIIPPISMKYSDHDEITILDISVGGIALECKESNVRLEAGETYADCTIELPEIGTLIATIEVKNLFDVTSPNGTPAKHAGCEFVQLDGKMSMLLQRYIGIMQKKST